MLAWLVSLLSLFPVTPPLAPMYPEGSFRAGGPASSYEWSRPHNPEAQYDSNSPPGTGVLRSGPFKLPGVIHFYEVGFPSRPGLRVYLLDESGKQTLDLRQRIDPGFGWKIHFWSIPSAWIGKNVRLVAEDSAKGPDDWFGITAPEEGREPLALSFIRAFYVSISLLIEGLVFLLPGIAIAAMISKRMVSKGIELSLLRLISSALCGSGSVAYTAFWIYLASAQLGKIFSVVVAAASIAIMIRDRRFLRLLPAAREAFACLCLTMLVSMFYCSLGFLFQTDDGVGEQAQVRYNLGNMPPDNLLPAMLAEKLYKDEAPKPVLFAFWHSSDRPPLQSGITLLTLPLDPPTTFVRQYLLVSIFAQGLWIPGLWVLIRSAKLGVRYLVPVLGFSIFSALCIFHSFFVWSKLLSGGFALLVFAFILQNVWGRLDVVLAATSLVLCLLSHTGGAFTILPLVIFALMARRLPGWRGLALAAAVILMFVLPWRWYQTIYDPPGDTLMKSNLAGVEDPVGLAQPLSKVMIAEYSRITPAQYFASKVFDLKVLFTGGEFDKVNFSNWRSVLAAAQAASFYHLFWAIGLLNVAFFARLFAQPSRAVRFADLCILVVLASIPIWFLVMFRPGATVIHQWSLCNVILIFAASVIYLLEASPKLVYPLLALQALIVFPLYVLAKPFIQEAAGALYDAPLDPGMAGFSLCMFIVIVLFGWRAKLQEANELSA